jgi:AcrR family transcriptional regulator
MLRRRVERGDGMETQAIVRRTQVERRQRTQELVLDAAIELLFERGYVNFTTADVAERAGVSRGAQNHYFRTKNDLVLSACRRAMGKAIENAKAMAAEARRSSDVLNYFIDQSRRFFLTPAYIATIDLLVAARTDFGLSNDYNHLIGKTRDEIDAIWMSVFVEAGFNRKRAFLLMSLSHNLMRGMAISSLWGTSSAENDKLVDEWRRLILQVAKADKTGKADKTETTQRVGKAARRRKKANGAK